MKFQIGDRVKAIRDIDGLATFGHIGTIVFSSGGSIFGVVFDEPVVGAHDLRGRCECGYGLYCYDAQIELVTDALFKKASEREYISELGGI